MIKLYKRSEEQTLYWEAWDTGERSVTFHWGTLGTEGRQKALTIPDGESPETVIEQKSREAQANGYEEIDLDDHSQIVVQYKTADAWGDGGDLGKRYEVEDLLDECLGWTGNGHCDGGDIGSGTINAFCFVVDPYLAKEAIVTTLEENGLIDGAVLVVDNEDDCEVLWPEDFKGEFSIL